MTKDRFARGLTETFHVSLRPVTENWHTLNSAHVKSAKANHMTKPNISGLRKYNLYVENPWQGREGKNHKQIIPSITSAFYYKEKKGHATSTTLI